MSKFIDLTGKIFGRLTVISKNGSKNGKLLWKCKCKCGNIKIVPGIYLTQENTTSCGCYHKEIVSKRNTKDLTNITFGLLRVICKEGITKHHKSKWKCKCKCGNVVSVIGGCLTSGNTRSCGCLHGHVGVHRSIDLVGKKFERLTVIQKTDKRTNGRLLWECKCDCGNVHFTTSYSLRSGHSKSCGCYNLSCISKRSIKDLTGKQFGSLTVMYLKGRTSAQQTTWWCKCICGKEVEVSVSNLVSGGVKSCGCYKKAEQQMRFNDINYVSKYRMRAQMMWDDKKREELDI